MASSTCAEEPVAATDRQHGGQREAARALDPLAAPVARAVRVQQQLQHLRLGRERRAEARRQATRQSAARHQSRRPSLSSSELYTIITSDTIYICINNQYCLTCLHCCSSCSLSSLRRQLADLPPHPPQIAAAVPGDADGHTKIMHTAHATPKR